MSDTLSTFQRALDFAGAQTQRLLTMRPGYAPMYTVGGKWGLEGERWTHWCEGFFPGILWLLYKHTADEHWRKPAEEMSRALEPRRHDRTVHDLGFLFLSTAMRWYHLDGGARQREVLIDAGRTLALRHQTGGYLASFMGPWSLFIDIMMNVGVIFWAARATGDESLRDIAIEHCRTSAKYLVRADGGTAHEATFDVISGTFREQTTQQGWTGASTWSRGLAWSLYGFTAAHRFCGEVAFLDVARANAECYLRRTPNLIPPWDFDVPAGVSAMPDSSAAAIAASGLWDLSEACNEPRYREAAVKILTALCHSDYLAIETPGWEGILKQGVYHYHKGLGVAESVAWGEHFFVEALVKACAGRSAAAW